MSWTTEPGGVMCFSPTMEQFRDFSAFITYMEDQGAHKYGIAKVRKRPLAMAVIVVYAPGNSA